MFTPSLCWKTTPLLDYSEEGMLDEIEIRMAGHVRLCQIRLCNSIHSRSQELMRLEYIYLGLVYRLDAESVPFQSPKLKIFRHLQISHIWQRR